jgi:Type III flagellar switch regulator (C-ring) FliN C-term
MNAVVRTIQLPGATALAAIAQRLQAALSPWLSEWTPTGSVYAFGGLAVDARCVDGESALLAADFETAQTSAGTLWIRRSAADVARLGRAVVGDAMMPQGAWADDWVADVVEHAWTARNRAIASALLQAVPAVGPLPVGALPSSIFACGAGSVYLLCDPLGLHVVADHSIWRSMPPQERNPRARAKLMPLDAAAQHSTARIDVVLGAVELDVSKVLDLRRGDVLRLPQSLGEGLGVLCEGQLLARGVPGERHGRKCVQLTSPLSNS